MDDGVISQLLANFDPAYRPLIELIVLVIGGGGAIAAAVNPIIDLLRRIADGVQWIGQKIAGGWRKLFGPKPKPEPAPGPIPPIPKETTVWEQHAPTNPIFPLNSSIPIIAVANMKGGVGKTTIVANLTPYFKRTRSKPVLLIDFDYQGSLTQTILSEAEYTDVELASHLLISPQYAGVEPIKYARLMRRGLDDVYIYSATYALATIENNLLADWLSDPANGLMYRLCALLREPAFQEKFGAVLIDCPPRLTAGSINALCASTHLLVPTCLDEMSAQAAEYFLSQVSRMQDRVFPKLKVLGVVPSIHHSDKGYLSGEERALDRLAKYGKSNWNRDDFILEVGRIPRKADVSNASGFGIPYLRKSSVRLIFDKLGSEIEKHL